VLPNLGHLKDKPRQNRIAVKRGRVLKVFDGFAPAVRAIRDVFIHFGLKHFEPERPPVTGRLSSQIVSHVLCRTSGEGQDNVKVAVQQRD
jgi:hypothetical protein